MAKANVIFTKDNEYYTPKSVIMKIQDKWEVEFISNELLKGNK